jgi:uncharacterized membrane-anchored protein YhcB (DUF1043 family)
MSDQLFYLFSAVLLGLVIGALIMYFSSGEDKSSKETIAELEKKLNSYQNDVAEHFEETANLVDDMTQSYKKVFDHMGKSARLLMTEEQIAEQIEKRKGNKVTLEFLTDEANQETENVKPASHDDEADSSEPTKKDYDQIEVAEIIDPIEGEDLDNIEDVVLSEKDDVIVEEVKLTEEAELVDLEQEVEIREKNIYS